MLGLWEVRGRACRGPAGVRQGRRGAGRRAGAAGGAETVITLCAERRRKDCFWELPAFLFFRQGRGTATRDTRES